MPRICLPISTHPVNYKKIPHKAEESKTYAFLPLVAALLDGRLLCDTWGPESSYKYGGQEGLSLPLRLYLSRGIHLIQNNKADWGCGREKTPKSYYVPDTFICIIVEILKATLQSKFIFPVLQVRKLSSKGIK